MYKLTYMIALPLIAFTSMAFAIPNATQVGTYGPTQASGSDAASVQYNAFYNSTISPYLLSHSSDGTLSGAYSFSNQASPAVTTLNTSNSAIPITQQSSIRFYYVNSNAGFLNAGGAVGNTTVNAGDNTILFPSNQPNPGPATGSYVNLPGLYNSTNLNLYLLANMDNNGSQNLWWSQQSLNSDGAYHVQVAQFTGADGTQYYLIAWDDQANASDRDFNDFTMVAAVTPVPEPGFYLMMSSFLGMALYYRHKTNGKSIQANK